MYIHTYMHTYTYTYTRVWIYTAICTHMYMETKKNYARKFQMSLDFVISSIQLIINNKKFNKIIK